MFGRSVNVSRGIAASATAARAAAAGAAIGGAVAGLGGALVGVVLVNKVLQDDERLPPSERQSRAAARITGSVAATAASLGSGMRAAPARDLPFQRRPVQHELRRRCSRSIGDGVNRSRGSNGQGRAGQAQILSTDGDGVGPISIGQRRDIRRAV